MSKEWKPGDLASISIASEKPHGIARYTEEGWRCLEDDYLHRRKYISDARPVVVIDPEDREQVERLESLYLADAHDGCEDTTDCMQAALREFANPEPPKPEEPKGLGAVVEDADGVRWTRTEHKPNMTGTVWQSAFHVTQADRSLSREYADIDAVRVLSEGVTA